MVDYTLKLKKDLLEQFKDLPNINSLIEVIGEQSQELARFYADLQNKRSIDNSDGEQLDGVGDIVVLNRAEAGELACFPSPDKVLDDELYRKFLYYKMFKNSNNTTYSDIIKSFRLFWDKPLHYSEDPNVPATMVFTSDILSPEDEAEKLLTAPIIKAAGVALIIIAITQTPEMNRKLHVTGVMGRGISITKLPVLELKDDWSVVERITAINGNVIKTVLPEL